tara:strand:- start:17899 stop:19314 length:1416 start_codon:yes stop_codon:yes gene_type:complete
LIAKLKEGHWPIFILSSFSAMANLFLPIILTRLLSPTDIGIYKIFFLYLGLLPFLFLTGGPLHSVYYWVGKKEGKDSYLTSAFQLSCFLSLLIVIVCLPLSSWLSALLELEIDYILILILSACLWIPSSFYKEYIIARGATIWGSVFGTFMEIIKVILFVSMAYFKLPLVTIFFSFLIYVALKFLLTMILLKNEGFSFLRYDKKSLKEVLYYCVPIASAGLLNFLVDKMDQIVLAKYLATDDFAFYSMGCLMIPPLYMLEVSITKVLIPKISEHHNQKELALEYFKKAISDSALLLIPACVGLFVFATPIVELLYTDSYTDSGAFLKIFAFSYLILIIPYDSVLRATGQTKWIFNISLIISPLSLLAIITTSNFFNAKIVLITSIIFKALFRFAGLYGSCQVMNWKFVETLPLKKLSIFTLFSIFLGSICLSLKNNFQSSLWWFLVCGGGFFILYFIFLIYTFKKGYFNEK